MLSAAVFIARGQTAPLPKAPAGRAPHGKLVFVLTTGFEDLQTANMMLKQVKLAKDAGYLEDVAVVVYGRGVQLFENIGARPQVTAQLIRTAQAAGVHFYVCSNALNQLGSTGKTGSDAGPDCAVRHCETFRADLRRIPGAAVLRGCA